MSRRGQSRWVSNMAEAEHRYNQEEGRALCERTGELCLVRNMLLCTTHGPVVFPSRNYKCRGHFGDFQQQEEMLNLHTLLVKYGCRFCTF